MIVLLAGSNDGSVYAFDSQTGRVQWQQKLGAAVATSIRATAIGHLRRHRRWQSPSARPSNGDVRSSLNVDSALNLTSAPAYEGCCPRAACGQGSELSRGRVA